MLTIVLPHYFSIPLSEGHSSSGLGICWNNNQKKAIPVIKKKPKKNPQKIKTAFKYLKNNFTFRFEWMQNNITNFELYKY